MRHFVESIRESQLATANAEIRRLRARLKEADVDDADEPGEDDVDPRATLAAPRGRRRQKRRPRTRSASPVAMISKSRKARPRRQQARHPITSELSALRFAPFLRCMGR
jgi:hypothetical protein